MGELVQNAFPQLSSACREFLITSICVSCQGQIFNDPVDQEKLDGCWWEE